MKSPRIQVLAVDALNIWRDHVSILADACEEEGRDFDANYLREIMGERSVALPVDHHGTRARTVKLEQLVRQLLRLAAPNFYLSRSPSKKKVVLKIWTRENRRCVHTFEPQRDTDGSWLPYQAKFTVSHLSGKKDHVTLDISAEVIAGCTQPRVEPAKPVRLGREPDEEYYDAFEDDYSDTW